MSLIGSIVHFVVEDGPETVHGQCRPALVVQDGSYTKGAGGGINVQVFRDGPNDRRVIVAGDQSAYDDALTQWETNIPHSGSHHFRSWHLPTECHHRGG